LEGFLLIAICPIKGLVGGHRSEAISTVGSKEGLQMDNSDVWMIICKDPLVYKRLM
jgi:hypothetical protein